MKLRYGPCPENIAHHASGWHAQILSRLCCITTLGSQQSALSGKTSDGLSTGELLECKCPQSLHSYGESWVLYWSGMSFECAVQSETRESEEAPGQHK